MDCSYLFNFTPKLTVGSEALPKIVASDYTVNALQPKSHALNDANNDQTNQINLPLRSNENDTNDVNIDQVRLVTSESTAMKPLNKHAVANNVHMPPPESRFRTTFFYILFIIII